MIDRNKEKSDIGVKTVLKFLENQDYQCKDVALDKEAKGYDIFAIKNGEPFKIEVKCSSKEKDIPDCFGTEFDEKLNIVSDFFYIVRINEKDEPFRIEILSREEMNRYSDLHKEKRIIKISNKLKTDLSKGKIGKKINL